MVSGTTIVHVTHEAADKIGGIGAVLEGLFCSRVYLENVERSIIAGVLFNREGSADRRLGGNGKVLYSSIDGIADSEYTEQFRRIELTYDVAIVYGRRTFVDEQTGQTSSPEVLLIDVKDMKQAPIEYFKGQLFEHFGIESNKYEHIWEYEQYIRQAPVVIEALEAIGAAGDSTIIAAHEFMGMPTALAGILERRHDFKTIFYAHEVATVRRIVEDSSGKDVMFYNLMKHTAGDLYAEQLFECNDYFKHPLIKASRHCDCIFAVGDYVKQELRFLAPQMDSADINIVYNGIPAYKISLEEKILSKQKLQQYCYNLLGYKPDFVFTHVTRLVESKGLWRDLQVLENIEKQFAEQNKTAVMFLLSTQVCQRDTRQIHKMESEYGWPVAHRESWPDMSGGEAEFYVKIQAFNARSRNVKVVFINQFGFNRQHCGSQMPEGMEFMDIRKGSDVEFGMSIYEPFGIAQLEPLSFGGICVVSNVCGCAGFVRDISNGSKPANVIEADYIQLNGHLDGCGENVTGVLRNIDTDIRGNIEKQVSGKIAEQIIERLAKNESELEKLLNDGYDLAKDMSWDTVVEKYLLKSLEQIAGKIHAC